jgi:CBS domain containing-hemolysin-like protein
MGDLAISLGVLLLLSGVFSGAETALFSISPLRLREMGKSSKPADRVVARVMERPRNVLVTILIGNIVVNILASSLGAAAAIRALGNAGAAIALATVVMTFLILVLGEIAPKTIAFHHAEPIARALARPLEWLGRIVTPVRVPLLRLTNLVLGKEAAPSDAPIDLAELETMLRLAHAEGEVETHERDLIRGVIELGSSPIEDVMTPRTEIVSVPTGTTVREARDVSRRSGFSKLPVAGGAPDEMSGFVTALDLLLADDAELVEHLAHAAAYVPEVKPAVELLEEFREAGRQLAFVVDEHGHLSGLVTLTDLLEEISGEMIERGDLHKVLYERLGRDGVAIPARMEIRFFNEEFGTEIESEESETMGGLLLERTGRIPSSGETFSIDGLTITVLHARPHRLDRLEVGFPQDSDRGERHHG